jgi:hypothetical protein
METQTETKPTRDQYAAEINMATTARQTATRRERDLREELHQAAVALDIAHREFVLGAHKPTPQEILKAVVEREAEQKLKMKRGELPARMAPRAASPLDASAIQSKGHSIDSPRGSAFRRGNSPVRGGRLPSQRSR